MKHLPIIGFATAAILLIADQAAKMTVVRTPALQDGGLIDVTSFFRLRYIGNSGVSLGLLTAHSDLGRWALVGLTVAIAIGVLVWLLREPNRSDQVGLGLILGGAASNILDRARLGAVVDYADLHFQVNGADWSPFLVFNVADAAITVGVLVLLLRALLVRERPVRAGLEKENA
jgi:signal peptidase II